MFELTKLLVIVDADTDFQPALDKAAELARHTGAELELFIADFSVYLEDGYYFEPARAQLLRERHAQKQINDLERMAKPLRDEGLKVSYSCSWRRPVYEQIIEKVEKTNPSLVIKSTQPHNNLLSTLLSNEDWNLIRYCPAPLLLVKVGSWGTKPIFIAAVDPGHQHDKPAALDHKLIDVAQALAKTASGEVHLFHSTKLPSLSGLYPLNEDYEVDLEKTGKLAAKHSIEKARCHMSELDVRQSLPQLVSDLDAAVVIMGGISRSRLDRFLIGNTAEKVLDKVWSDVLVVKPDPRQKLLM